MFSKTWGILSPLVTMVKEKGKFPVQDDATLVNGAREYVFLTSGTWV